MQLTLEDRFGPYRILDVIGGGIGEM